jgi:hypothetical protein
MKKTQELADKLAKNWIQNYTLSGRLAFIKNEEEREAIFTEAVRLGIRDDVYELASKIMKGEV